MSSSLLMREIITKNKIENNYSKRQDRIIKEAVDILVLNLRKIFPYVPITHEQKLEKTEIAKILHSCNKNCGIYISNNNSFIKPDGGFVFALIKKKKHLILSVEAKKQGTNDIRVKEGKPVQAKGNAIDRLVKNYHEIENYQQNELIFPYIVFVSGCDFNKYSSIIDRVTSTNFQCEINKIQILKLIAHTKLGKRHLACASLFIREKEWNIKEVYKIIKKAAIMSIRYYLEKD